MLKFWPPFAFLALAPLGDLMGGAGSYLLLAVMPVSLVGLDFALGSPVNPTTEPADSRFRALPWLYIPLQLALIAWAATVIARPTTGLPEAIGLTLTCGLTAGVFGFLAAHEMVHSRRAAERALGLTMLAGVLYLQFAIAHLHGHHRRGATPEDPATARRGESAYAFMVRSVAGQAAEAWRFEAQRLRLAGRPVFGPGNRMIAWFAIEALLVLAIGLWSLRALAFFLADAAVAVILLELFNYIAHYGLVRRRDPAGRLERLGPRHCWNSARRMTNWTLFNMGRHSDHHRFAGRAYQELEVLGGGAELPTGYAGAILMALIPPLWRKVMDPRADRVMGAGPSGPAPHDARPG
jgi:alkane 1-monooxygenase